MFLNAGTTDKIFQQSGKQDSFRQILSLVHMKVQAGSSLEQPLEYNQEKMLLKNHLFTKLVTKIVSSFRLVLEGKAGKEISESSR